MFLRLIRVISKAIPDERVLRDNAVIRAALMVFRWNTFGLGTA